MKINKNKIRLFNNIPVYLCCLTAILPSASSHAATPIVSFDPAKVATEEGGASYLSCQRSPDVSTNAEMRYNFNTITPLFPCASKFYGGLDIADSGTTLDSTSKDGWRLHPNKANDWPQFSSVFFSGVDTSSQANFYDVTALYIWKKVDFTGVTESATVKFNPSSILNVTIKKWVAVAKEKAKPSEFRFIVRNGTKYYISEAKYSTAADVMEVSDAAFNLVDFNNNSKVQ